MREWVWFNAPLDAQQVIIQAINCTGNWYWQPKTKKQNTMYTRNTKQTRITALAWYAFNDLRPRNSEPLSYSRGAHTGLKQNRVGRVGSSLHQPIVTGVVSRRRQGRRWTFWTSFLTLNSALTLQSPTPQIVTLSHKGLTYHFQFWHSGTLALSPKCQSARTAESLQDSLWTVGLERLS